MSDVVLSLHCVVTAKPPFHLNAPMLISGTLYNTGEVAVWILVQNTFLSRRGHHSLVLMLGNEHLHDIAHSTGSDSEAREFMRIPPGGSVTAHLDIAESYAVTKPGIYQLALSMPVYGGVEQASNQQPTLEAHYKTVFVASEPIAVEIEAGIPVTDVASVAAFAQAAPSAPPSSPTFPEEPLYPIFDLLNAGEQAEILEAHRWAYRSILSSLTSIQSLTDSGYEQWMDATSTGDEAIKRRAKVKAKLTKMAERMSSQHVTYRKNDTPRQTPTTPDWIAAVGEDGAITLRSRAFEDKYLRGVAWNDGVAFRGHASTQAFVVLHEVSHAAAATVDNIAGYSRDVCATLAQKNPNASIENAQNYAFYGMSGNQNSPPPNYKPNNGMWDAMPIAGVGCVSPAGMAAASIPTKFVVMIAYQDEATQYGGALWFKVLVDAHSKASAKWLHAVAILNVEDNQSYCSFWDNRDWHVNPRPAPALLGRVEGNDHFFYCAYVDLYTKRPVLVKTGRIDDALKAQDFQGIRWRKVSNLHDFPESSDAYGPALAYYDEHIYCVYVTSENKLKCLRSKDGAQFVEVLLQRHSTILGTNVCSSPALAVFEGSLICTYRSGSYTKQQNLLCYVNGSWDNFYSSLEGKGLAENLAIGSRTSMGEEWLVALGVGQGLTSLRYWVSTNRRPISNSAFLGRAQFMAAKARTCTALASIGSTMHGFYQHEDRQLGWLIVEDDFTLPLVPTSS